MTSHNIAVTKLVQGCDSLSRGCDQFCKIIYFQMEVDSNSSCKDDKPTISGDASSSSQPQTAISHSGTNSISSAPPPLLKQSAPVTDSSPSVRPPVTLLRQPPPR